MIILKKIILYVDMDAFFGVVDQDCLSYLKMHVTQHNKVSQ